MDRQLEKILYHIRDTIGLFLIATRFRDDLDTTICIANKKYTVWEVFKIMCNSKVEYKNKKILKQPKVKKYIEIWTHRFLNENSSWNFDNIFSYLFSLEKAKNGILNIGTPFEVIDEMLDKIPFIDIIANNNFELPYILDPACGRGRFLFKIKKLLLKEGYDEKEIIEHLYGIDIDLKSAFLTAALIDPKGLCKKTNIYCADTLNNYPKELEDMKFDVIVGNPPFQEVDKKTGKSKPGGANLFSKFIDKSINCYLKDGGIISFITPTSWFSPTGQWGKTIKKYKLHQLHVNTFNDSFPVSSQFCWFMLQKSVPEGTTHIISTSNGSTYEFDGWINDLDFLPLILNTPSINIIKKIVNKKPKINIIFDYTFDPRRNELREISDNTFEYPVYHTSGKILYSSIPHKVQYKSKVVMSDSGYLSPRYDSGKYGVSQHAPYILVSGRIEGENLITILNCKMYKFFITTCKYSGFHTPEVLRQIPLIDISKNYTDQEIYEYFGLTDEEIELIEETIKD